ncbi:hypothetical protein AAMO2058_001698700 [Amorphochlora amoebiformis]
MENGEDPPKRFICPITKQVMTDPAHTSELITYEYKAIAEYLNQAQECMPKSKIADPVTGRPLQNLYLIPNLKLKGQIRMWREKKCNQPTSSRRAPAVPRPPTDISTSSIHREPTRYSKHREEDTRPHARLLGQTQPPNIPYRRPLRSDHNSSFYFHHSNSNLHRREDLFLPRGSWQSIGSRHGQKDSWRRSSHIHASSRGRVPAASSRLESGHIPHRRPRDRFSQSSLVDTRTPVVRRLSQGPVPRGLGPFGIGSRRGSAPQHIISNPPWTASGNENKRSTPLLRQESSTSDGLGEDLGVRFEFDRDEGDGSRNWARISRSPPRYSRSTSWNQRSQPPLFQATSSIQLPRSLSSISTSSHSEVKQGPTISRHSSSGTPGRLSSRSLYNGSSSSEILSSRSLYNASR